MLFSLQGKRMHLATLWLGIAGITIMAMLMARKVKGAIMMGILFTTFISWIPGHQASYLGAGSQVPGGARRFAINAECTVRCFLVLQDVFLVCQSVWAHS
eukprot:GHUV01031005.1.p1 GENE.GHUV01031005.1~~GHUV01031005.1.p1  ORF type:complete len:100 (-),score=15.55 GHUV01031005.1:527-826(-)